MKELVKKISKAVLVLCLSMVMMIGSGSAWGAPLCRFDPDHLTVCDRQGICVKDTESLFGRTVESVEVTVLNKGAQPDTLTLQFWNDGVYVDTDPNTFSVLQPDETKTETITQTMDKIQFQAVSPAKFEIGLRNEKCAPLSPR